MRRRPVLIALEIAVPAALVAIWWVVSEQRQSFYFPPLAEIVERFREVWIFARFGSDLVPSLVRLLLGYLIAVVLGIGGGLVLGMNPHLRSFSSVVLEFLRSMPSVALIPFAIALFGVGPSMQVFIIAFGSLWPVLLNATEGVRGVDIELRHMARVYQVRLADYIARVALPAASPQIVAGMRSSLSIALIMMVVSEMMASTNGLGYFILQAQRGFAISEMWAGIILIGIVGYVLNVVFVMTEHRVMRWHRGSVVDSRQT